MREWKAQGYRSREAADGTEMRKQYDRYNKKANSLSQKLKAARKQQAINEFHNSVHVEEIDRQLRGIKPSDIIAPSHIEYDLPERARVAYLFSQAADMTDRDSIHSLRIELITAISQLCKRQESPCRGSKKRGRKLVASKAMTRSIRCRFMDGSAHGTIEEIGFLGPTNEALTQGPPTQGPHMSGPTCPFCEWHGIHGESQRIKTWRLDNLSRHIRDQHLKRKRTTIPCPWPACEAILADAEHFASHAARHGLDLPPSILRR